jgi:hypothetical protein
VGLSTLLCQLLVLISKTENYQVGRCWWNRIDATMCGILVALGLQGDPEKNRRMMLRQSRLLRHRGPDANAIWQSADGHSFIAFERLQIIDVTDGGK